MHIIIIVGILVFEIFPFLSLGNHINDQELSPIKLGPRDEYSVPQSGLWTGHTDSDPWPGVGIVPRL